MSRSQQFDADTTYSTSDIAVGGGSGITVYLGGVRRGMKPVPGRSVQSLKFFYGDKKFVTDGIYIVADKKRMIGFEIKLTDGIHALVGRHSDSATETFYFAEGEKVSSLKVWTNAEFTGRCGKIELKTDKNRQFNVDCPADGDPYVYDIGSGTLAGVFGKFGDDIDCLGFSLLRHKVLQNYKD